MSRWGREPRVLWRRSGPRVVLLAPGAADLVVLDGVGSLIWQLLGQPIEYEELRDDLASHFASDARRLEDELSAFLRDLEARGALVLEAAEGP
jgi:hypothetical protein